MPSTKDRLNIYLDADMSETIRRAAEVRGVSRAQVVTDILDSIRPQFKQMVDLLELARRAPEALSADLRSALDAAYAELEPHATGSMEAFDALQHNLEDAINDALVRTKQDLAA